MTSSSDNIVEVLHQSRGALAVLQEISHDAKLDALCAQLDARAAEDQALALSRWDSQLMGFSAATVFGLFWFVNRNARPWAFAWPHSKGKPVGEHALVYNREALAAALGCARAEDVVVEAAQHAPKPTLSKKFYAATQWSESPTPRDDFKFQGSKGARLPTLFFARAMARARARLRGRSLYARCTSRLDTRTRAKSSWRTSARCCPATAAQRRSARTR